MEKVFSVQNLSLDSFVPSRHPLFSGLLFTGSSGHSHELGSTLGARGPEGEETSFLARCSWARWAGYLQNNTSPTESPRGAREPMNTKIQEPDLRMERKLGRMWEAAVLHGMGGDTCKPSGSWTLGGQHTFQHLL